MLSTARLAILAAAVATSAPCPSDDWVAYSNGKCYRMVQFYVPWYTVDEICNYGNPGAESASVHDLLHNAFMAETVAHGSPAWLGLSRAGASSAWAWSDGSQYNYNNWRSGEPTGDCAFINYGKEGEWATMDCDFSSSVFLCQIDDENASSRAPTATESVKMSSGDEEMTSGDQELADLE